MIQSRMSSELANRHRATMQRVYRNSGPRFTWDALPHARLFQSAHRRDADCPVTPRRVGRLARRMNVLITNSVPLNGGDEALLRSLLDTLAADRPAARFQGTHQRDALGTKRDSRPRFRR